MSDGIPGKPKGAKTERRSRQPDPMVAAAIGQKLRTMYDDVLSEPVPDALADLVRRLSGGAEDGKTGS